MAAKKKSKPLTPIDLLQCQVEKPNGHSFMTLGGIPALERCTNAPTVVLTERKPNNGQTGEMTACDGCLAVFRKQMPRDFAIIRDITDTWPETWRALPTCDLCSKPASFTHPRGGLRCLTCHRPELGEEHGNKEQPRKVRLPSSSGTGRADLYTTRPR